MLHGPRLIPGRPTGKSVAEAQARARAAALNPNPNAPIPLYGALHGMAYEPTTRKFTGDGPPRSKPLRSDGTGPCTGSMTTPRNPTANGQPITDQLHIQPKAFVEKSMKGFGKDGNVKTWHLEKPEGMVAQREEDEKQFQTVEGAKKDMKARELKEEQDYEVVTGEKKNKIVGGAGVGEVSEVKKGKMKEAGGAVDGDSAEVKVRDFANDPIKEKKKVHFGKKNLTMAEKLKAQFAKGL